MIVKISKGQQITIPLEFRKELNLRSGNNIDIEKRGNSIIIKPIDEDLEELFEEAKKTKPKYKLSAKDIDKLVENEIHRQ